MGVGLDAERARLEALARAGGLHALIGDLTPEDVPLLDWSGGPLHLRAVAAALARRAAGEVEYLVLRTPDGSPVSKAGIDYTRTAGAATVWQVATHPDLQGLGLGGAVLAAAHDRIRRRSLHVARLGVEPDNTRARRLYEYLGYREVGREPDSWPTLDEHGCEVTYTTELVTMEKRLS